MREPARALNRMALVCCSWHNVLAPPNGACTPALTRWVTLGEANLLLARPWWRYVKARRDAADTGLASLAAGCTAITTLNLSRCNQIGDAGLASLAAGCTANTTLNLRGCNQIGDAELASLAARCTVIATGLGCPQSSWQSPPHAHFSAWGALRATRIVALDRDGTVGV